MLHVHAPIPPRLVYGLDIETDTRTGGLDPATSAVVAIAVTGEGFAKTFVGDESDLLHQADRFLAELEPGVLVTWNGSGFDLPYIADRQRMVGNRGGLCLHERPNPLEAHPPLAGHLGRYGGTWHGHRHLDAYLVYRNDLKRQLDVSCSLKSVAALAGVAACRFDASRVHELSDDELITYVTSDAAAARSLALRRWRTAEPFIDPPGRTHLGTVPQR